MAGWKVGARSGQEIPKINPSIYLLRNSDITDSNTINLAWKPALYIENLKEMKIKKAFANQEVMQLRMNQSTVVKYTSHLELTWSCSMKFKQFPFDEQYCDLNIYELHLRSRTNFNMRTRMLNLGRFSEFSPTVRDYKYALLQQSETGFNVEEGSRGRKTVATVGFRLKLTRVSSKYFVMLSQPNSTSTSIQPQHELGVT